MSVCWCGPRTWKHNNEVIMDQSWTFFVKHTELCGKLIPTSEDLVPEQTTNFHVPLYFMTRVLLNLILVLRCVYSV